MHIIFDAKQAVHGDATDGLFGIKSMLSFHPLNCNSDPIEYGVARQRFHVLFNGQYVRIHARVLPRDTHLRTGQGMSPTMRDTDNTWHDRISHLYWNLHRA